MLLDAFQDKARLLLARARRGRPGGRLSGIRGWVKRRGADGLRIGAGLAGGLKRISTSTVMRLRILRHAAARSAARKPETGTGATGPARSVRPAPRMARAALATFAAKTSAGFAAALARTRKAKGENRIAGTMARLRRQARAATGAIPGAAGRLKQRVGKPGERRRLAFPPQGVPEAQRGAGPAWEAPVAAATPAESRFKLAEVLGLATRLGLVALFIAGGLAVILLNTPAGEAIGDRLKRTAPTGSVFDAPFPSAAGEEPPEEPGASAATSGPVPKVAPIASPRLLSPPVTATAEDFVRLAMVDPKRVCQAIDPGDGIMAWHESALLTGQWECFATATASGEEVAPEPDFEDAPIDDDPDVVAEPALPDVPQLFVMARGLERDALTSVRIKLVADGAAKAKRGAKRLAALTAALFDTLQWRAPDELFGKLEKLEDFELVQAGTRFRFKRELSQGWQYNLIVLFPNYVKYRQASAFQTPKPEPSDGDAAMEEPSGPSAVPGGEP
ncbi:hypothetical protein ATO4_04055 [Aurantimonas sp. 22II-16-19i]|nr:hypothetical protein ATO4_04055 [Aurantimonas sp. 22II-16-19i]